MRLRSARLQIFVLLLLCPLATFNVVSLWNNRHLIREGHSDFISFYSAGVLLRTGQGSALFSSQAQFTVQSVHSSFVRERRQPFPYIHPPVEALLFVPLSYLSYPAAYLTWTGISLLAMVASLRLLRREMPAMAVLPVLGWVVILLAFFPTIAALAQGQDDLVLLLVFTLVFIALKRGRNVVAGMWLAIAMMRPQFALPMMAVLLCSGEWRAVGCFLAGVAGLSLVTVPVFGFSVLADYPGHVWFSEQISNPNGALLGSMPNLHGLVGQTLGNRVSPATLNIVVLILSGLVLMLAVACWRRRDSLETAFSAAVLAGLLVSYHSFAPDLVLLILPGILVGWPFLQSEPKRRVWLWLAPVLLLVPPLCYVLVRYQRFNLVALALLVWLIGICVRIARPRMLAQLLS